MAGKLAKLAAADPELFAELGRALQGAWEVGYAAGVAADLEEWRPLAERIRRTAGQPTWDQIQRNRGLVEISPGVWEYPARPNDFPGRLSLRPTG